jgi:hypothetical protein
MRIPKGWISPLSKDIVEALCSKKLIEVKTSQEEFTEAVSELLLDELMVEDRLNKEVRELLKKYDMQIEQGRLDYRRLFDLTKQKLVKERNIIL